MIKSVLESENSARKSRYSLQDRAQNIFGTVKGQIGLTIVRGLISHLFCHRGFVIGYFKLHIPKCRPGSGGGFFDFCPFMTLRNDPLALIIA